MDATYEELERNDMKGPQEAERLTHAYAGFWVRFWAFLLDWLVVWGLNHLLVSPSLPYWICRKHPACSPSRPTA